MTKKLTYEYVKKSFEKEKYILLSKEYINRETKLDYICPFGHKHRISWGSWRAGCRCYYCLASIKKTIEEVKKSFKKEGYTLLSKKYVDNKTKLNYICPEGHRHYVSWNNWNKGCRCPTCSGNLKKTIEEIRIAFKAENYVLLSNDYKNNQVKLNYICPKGHNHSITWRNWVSGFRCPTCANINNSGPGHYNWQGGISFEPYCEAWKDQEYKQDIRNRDNNMCLNPYCNSPDSKDLTIHHIDYNKKNCSPKNLITVCRSCNSKANTDRKWHTAWYKAILNRRYGYGS